MDKIFEHLSSSWIRYFDYEWRTAKDGHEYLTPTAEAGVRPYDPRSRPISCCWMR